MVRIFIDGQAYEALEKKNLLAAIFAVGLELPYFCWHPAMGSVGACRQCAVKKFKDESDTRGRIVMACMEPVVEGLRLSIYDPEAVAFRASVIEWLMTNHPHDCPVCDEGGECHLQDMTTMSGHVYRKYRYNKRTHNNQYLGPFINHEMNRCIACYRCVRFYRDYAGGHDLDVFASRNRVYFGRHEDGILESEFSGNLVEVCPTGVFTDKTLKHHYTRKWDLTSAPSICPHCALGCNIIAGERYGMQRRVLSRYNSQVNGYFICDRGRFGYEYANHEKRLRFVSQHSVNEKTEKIEKNIALKSIAALFPSAKRVIGIGSPRASLEANFALHALVGAESFYNGISGPQQELIQQALAILQNGAMHTPSLREVEQADAVLILGEDINNTAPMLALAVQQSIQNQPRAIADRLNIPYWDDHAVREAVQDEKGPLFIITPDHTKLDKVATMTIRKGTAGISRIGFAVARAIDPEAPEVIDLPKDIKQQVEQIAVALKNAKNPLVISGCSCGSPEILQAAANVVHALCRQGKTGQICLTFPESNSVGLGMMAGRPMDGAIQSVEQERADLVIILENDLYRRADQAVVDRFLDHCIKVIVLDHLENPTTNRAHMLLPAAVYAETDGTLVNNEGRAQRFYRVYPAMDDIMESWRWLSLLLQETGKQNLLSGPHFENITDALVREFPVFSGIEKMEPSSSFRVSGQKIPRESHRYSGRTAITADKNISEPKPPADEESPFSFTMEGYRGVAPCHLIPMFWSPGWNSAQSINKFQIEVGGALCHDDPGMRLFKPISKNNFTYFTQVPPASRLGKEKWLVIPLYHIFGSEELSAQAAAISALVPEPYIALNEEDAQKLKREAGDRLKVIINGRTFTLPLRIHRDLPEGVSGIPVGLPGFAITGLPAEIERPEAL